MSTPAQPAPSGATGSDSAGETGPAQNPVQEALSGPSRAAQAPAGAQSVAVAERGAGAHRDVPDQPPATGRKVRRWVAAAVVVDVDGVHLSDGTVIPLPDPFSHAGHAAQLAHDLPLGHGGDADRMPDPGQVWLTPALCAQLGLPETVDPDREQRAKQLEDATTGCRWLEDAYAEGWKVGGERLTGWMRVWADGKRSVFVVYTPAVDPHLPVLEDAPPPGVLARRLQLFADATGTAFHVSPQAVGLDLLAATRTGRGIKTGRAEELRVVVEPVPPSTQPTVEDELRWSRTPTSAELETGWVHAYDRGGSYLAATSSVRLGIGAGERHDPAPAFDKDQVGYWRIKVPDAADWRLPNPLDPAGRALPGRAHWYTTTTLAAAAELGYEITPVEAYLWPASGRLLDGWYRRLRDARAGLDQVDVDARAARDLVKATYTRTIGGFAARHLAERPWHRPDWRHAIIATARSNVLRRVHTIGEQAGVWPVAMLIDAVLYVSDVAWPVCAWPGNPKLLGRGLGLYSPYGSAELTGHAQFLTGHDYKGTAALTQPGAWLAEHGCEQHRPPGDQ